MGFNINILDVYNNELISKPINKLINNYECDFID